MPSARAVTPMAVAFCPPVNAPRPIAVEFAAVAFASTPSATALLLEVLLPAPMATLFAKPPSTAALVPMATESLAEVPVTLAPSPMAMDELESTNAFGPTAIALMAWAPLLL
ncbi:hypothetical protein D3C71_1602660 [compost metagenome]